MSKENGSGESLESQDGVLYSKEMAASDFLWGQGKTIVAYPPDGKGPFAIPDSVTSIGNNAFSECHDLKSIRADYSINLSLNQILPSLQYLDEDEVRSFQLHPEKDGGKPQ